MKKQLLLLATVFTLTHSGLNAQCSLTASITTNRSTDLCSGDTVVLSGPDPGDAWTQKATIGGIGGRDGGVGFSIGNKGYIGTGWNNGTAYNDFWEYDPTTDTWTQKASMTGMRAYAFGISIGSKGYVGGGYNSSGGGSYNDFWEFDPSLNTWTQKANFGGGNIQYAPAFSIGSKGYVTTGQENGIDSDELWQYDPVTDTWTQKASFGGGKRTFATAFTLGGQGYVGTGYSSSIGNRAADLWAYDPSSDTWSEKAGIPGDSAARDGAIGFSIGNKGYISTGYSQNYGFINDLWEYDAVADSWSRKLAVPGNSRIRPTAFCIGNKGYLGAGINPNYSSLSDFYEYDPGLTYSWSTGDVSQRIKAGAANTYSLNVSSLATGSCIATATQTVGITLTPTISVIGISAICAGNSSTLTASGATTYSWSANAGGANTNTVIVAPVNNTTYQLTGANGHCAVTIDKLISVSGIPSVTITPSGATEICGAGSVTLTASDAGGVWNQKADFGGGIRTNAVAFSIGNKGYMGTGYGNYTETYDFWEYDPGTDSWTQKADFSGYIRQNATGFSIGNKGYLGLGVQFNYMNDFWEFDPAANTWTQKADFTGNTRSAGTAFSIGNKGYIGMGYDANYNMLKEFYEYDPANDTWTQKANFGGGVRTYPASFVIGNKGYVGTGDDSTHYPSTDIWSYDPASDNWTRVTDYPGHSRDGATSFAVNGMGYIGGGSYGGPLLDFWAYNPATDNWSQSAGLSNGAYLMRTFTIGSKAYAGTGNPSGVLGQKDFWEFDPSVNYSWSTGASTPSISVNSSANYIVTLTAGNGCSVSASQAFSITPNPTLTINGSNVICEGGNLSLTASGADTYTWSANAGTATGTTVNLAPTGTDSYTVTGSVNSCTNTVIQTVTVNTLPVVSITGSTSVCAGNTTTLTSTGATSYTWSSNAGGATSATVTLNPAGTDTYTVTGFDGNCSNTATQEVIVNTLPIVSVNSASICAGQSVTLTANGASSYSWSPAGTLSSASGHTVSAHPSGNTSYTVTGQNSNGCINTAVSNVVINCTATGIEQSNYDGTISIYPNPAGEFFYLYTNTLADNANIEVYDINGKKVMSESITDNITRLDISGLANGMYQVRIISNNALIYQSKMMKTH